ncbi:histidyl-tRNA synthetase [Chloroherpeton thalassium ATCC 35110]|uniref:Histidine--tRNA ligase n=1 Tax=Chloroherpeton thalassium (strain ATCC 35110 / GB-78) TaxID=517418 RepID=SYH_CHLT3|nr:histidine--tRNA ligase [Chloroherpeton thalassium]B3QS95.1 RecName: Full=Histidine--tRNA ligase; AltName: Full=Histidyl-tRNA synthetase; Short=HisRS [Chloroherpeton thalassium ATCC 35110]ACF12486.1 histidyl-tRNA synthetase [Chloroherpeton thalassium ATCC 35110]
MKFQTIKGTKDILPSEIHKWHYVENTVRGVFQRFGYNEIRTPVFEQTALFQRGIGETTDIVGKEMYSFQPDPESESLTLRPEMTAPVMRAYLQHSLSGTSPATKVFYISEIFRKERPQAGRQRQFWQFGCECIGSDQPEADAEVILLMTEIYRQLGIKNFTLRLNSLGETESRLAHREALQTYLKPHFDLLDEISKTRFEKNPLRILDSKNPALAEIIAGAPHITEFLDDASKAHFQTVQTYLKNAGLDFTVDPTLVRGLDYYSRTAFELVSTDLGAQDALAGGGRYDSLATVLGAKNSSAAVGFAAGIERLLIIMEKLDLFQAVLPPAPLLFIATQSPVAKEWAFQTVNRLRTEGIHVALDLLGRSLKAQMREANRTHAKYVLIVGEEELSTGRFQLKHLQTSEQVELSEADIFTKMQTETTQDLG